MFFVNNKEEGFGDWPSKLDGWWMHFAFLNDNPKFGGICQCYFNNKRESGTISYSNYMLNDYPDAYGTWKKQEDISLILADRVWLREDLRGKKIGPSLLFEIMKFFEYMKKQASIDKTSSIHGYNIWNDAFGNKYGDKSYLLNRDDSSFNIREETYEQPIYPSIFFYKREVFLNE